MSKDFILVYINGTPIGDSVFRSHIYSFLKFLKEKNINISFFSFTQDADSFSDCIIENKKLIEQLELKSVKFVKIPSQNFGFSPIRNIVYHTLRNYTYYKNTIFHINSYMMGYVFLGINKEFLNKFNHKTIVDFKGILPQECLFYDSQIFPLRLLRYFIALKMENFICSNTDGLIVVSNKFKDWIIKNKNIQSDKIWVIPSCFETEIFKYDKLYKEQMRKKLNLSEHPTIVYSGSLRKWQLPKEMFKFFSLLFRKNKNTRFLILTNYISEAELLISKSEIDKNNFILKNLSGSDLSNHLIAGDIGLLFRKNDIVNNVASPTKFGEYLGCGLSVVATNNIGDYSNEILNNNLGKIIPSKFSNDSFYQIAEWLFKNIDKIRLDSSRLSKWAFDNLSSEGKFQVAIEAYNRII